MDGIGAADVGAAGLGKDRKSYLLLLDQITDRAGHLLNWHGRIDAVLIEQVDIVGTKPAQGAFHRLTDMLTPAVPCRRRPAYCLIALETKRIKSFCIA